MRGSDEVILVCRCGDSPRFAEQAYHLQFPDAPADYLPRVILGKDALRAFSESLPPGQAQRLVNNIEGKFMYYLKYTPEGDVLHYQNLRDGRRLI